jgi:DNA-directed RNA polymerase subunit RPC12/RpoP
MLNADSLWKTLEIMDAQPTADVVERKKGFWEWVDDMDYRCSVCHKYAYGCLGEVLSGAYQFCPYCGAKMDWVDDGEEKTNEKD